MIIGLIVGVAAAIFGALFSLYEKSGVFIRNLLDDYWLFLSLTLFLVIAYALVKLFGWYEGSSTNKYLEYYHFEAGRIGLAEAIVFIIGSLITVFAGGSVGPEGPALILGGFIGYCLALYLLSKQTYEAKEYGLVGAGAAVAAVFKAPFTAMTFVLEVLYRRDLETSVFLETLVATVTAYLVSVLLTGPAGITSVKIGGSFIPTLNDILAGIIAGLAATIVARIMVTLKHIFADISKPLSRISVATGPIILSMVAWLLGRYHPFILGGGEHVAVEAIHGKLELNGVEAIVASTEKAALTTLTLTMGGTGGIFLPLVAIGGLLGYGLHQLIPFLDLRTVILASIAGVFAGTNSVVISAVLFGIEVLGGHAFIPSALAATIAYVLSMGSSLHSNQLPRREVAKKLALASLLHRVTEIEGFRSMLENIPAIEAANKNPVVLTVDVHVGEALRIAAERGHVAYPVVKDYESMKLVGYVMLEDLIAMNPDAKLGELVRPAPVINPSTSLLQAGLIMIRRDVDRLFVCDDDERLLGIITKTDLLRTLMNIYEELLEREIEKAFE